MSESYERPQGSPHLAGETNEEKESGKQFPVYKKTRAMRAGVLMLIAANRACQAF
jgi:hypothetical protein